MTDLSNELVRRLERLRDDLGDDCGDRHVATDETGYLRLIDRAARDPTAHALVDDIGHRFAEAFVTPYLHADDFGGVLREIRDLLAIHHRAGITLARIEPRRALITIDTPDAGEARTCVFDLAVVQGALAARFPKARVTPVARGGDDTAPSRLLYEITIADASP